MDQIIDIGRLLHRKLCAYTDLHDRMSRTHACTRARTHTNTHASARAAIASRIVQQQMQRPALEGRHACIHCAPSHLQNFAVDPSAIQIFIGSPGLAHAFASLAPKSGEGNKIRLPIRQNITNSSPVHQGQCQKKCCCSSRTHVNCEEQSN